MPGMTAFKVLSHEYLGEEVTEDGWRKLFLVHTEIDNNADEPCPLTAAVDQYLMAIGHMNHPDIGIVWITESVMSWAFYVCTEMDLT